MPTFSLDIWKLNVSSFSLNQCSHSLKVAVITQAPNQQIILTSPIPSHLYPIFIQSCGFCLLVGPVYLLHCWNNLPARPSSLHLASPPSTVHTVSLFAMGRRMCFFVNSRCAHVSFSPKPFHIPFVAFYSLKIVHRLYLIWLLLASVSMSYFWCLILCLTGSFSFFQSTELVFFCILFHISGLFFSIFTCFLFTFFSRKAFLLRLH